MKKRFTEAQIVGFLREADAGVPVKELCRKHGFSDGSYYLWRSKFGGMSVSDAVPARALGGLPVTRVFDRLTLERGLPRILRTDNGKEFCGRAMLTWAHERGLTLRLIEPGKPNQNAYIESFNGRFRDECLNEHWFTSLAHARVVIEDWRREYNDERPKKALGGLTPTAYAQQLTTRTETAKVTAGL